MDHSSLLILAILFRIGNWRSCLPEKGGNFIIIDFTTKGLYILTGTETFAKEPKFGKLLRELKSTPVSCSQKKSTGFCRMSVTASLLRLGVLLRDYLQMGAFS